ncbi:MAG TPA: leucine-rich repeat domain-containing protein, partial [Verrucomicrobiae bacterium]|nr:leucine-rich repeat domain-containing protein [Verrucomicrobiae bacterium]
GVSFPEKLVSIGEFAFSGCKGLKSLVIPDNVKVVGGGAFSACDSLSDVTLGNGISTINQGTFASCPGIASIRIPDSVISIQDHAFWQCFNLTNLNFGTGVTELGANAFEYSSIAVLALPESLTNIGWEAFGSCGNLPSVTIPANVRSIDNFAFGGCYNLQGIYFRGDAPTVVGAPFSSTSILYYVPGTQGWSSVFAGRPALPIQMQIVTGDSSFGVKTNQFGFNLTGTYGLPVVVEAATSLQNPVWLPVQTNTLADSPIYFTDPNWTNFLSRFYRLKWQ